jgi:hypothetical protein
VQSLLCSLHCFSRRIRPAAHYYYFIWAKVNVRAWITCSSFASPRGAKFETAFELCDTFHAHRISYFASPLCVCLSLSPATPQFKIGARRREGGFHIVCSPDNCSLIIAVVAWGRSVAGIAGHMGNSWRFTCSRRTEGDKTQCGWHAAWICDFATETFPSLVCSDENKLWCKCFCLN